MARAVSKTAMLPHVKSLRAAEVRAALAANQTAAEIIARKRDPA